MNFHPTEWPFDSMRRIGGWLVFAAVSLLAISLPGTSSPWTLAFAQAPSTQSPAAKSAASKFRRIEESAASGQPFGSVRISEQEINAYLDGMAPELPPGIANITLKLEPGRTSGTADIDFDRLKGTLKSPPNVLLAMLLRGQHTLGVNGSLSAANGVGQFHLEMVALDSVVMPQAMVDFLIDHYLRAHYPSVGADRPFTLGYGIDQLQVESGSILITSRPTTAANHSKNLPGALLPMAK